MKALKYSILFLIIAISSSCRDEEEVRMPSLIEAANVRVVVDSDNSFINFDQINESKFVYDVYSTNNNIDWVEFRAAYYEFSKGETREDTLTVETLSQSSFVNGKTRIEITAQELAEVFNIEGGVDGISGGDRFDFITVAKLKDGREYSFRNAAPSITANPLVAPTAGGSSFTTIFPLYVACPSDQNAIVGNYSAVTNAENPFGLDPAATKDNVTITFVGPEPFRYRVSSYDSDWWFLQTDNNNNNLQADFFDICGTVLMQSAGSGGFGNQIGTGGSYNPETGVIVMEWYNDNNDIVGTTTFTPKPN